MTRSRLIISICMTLQLLSATTAIAHPGHDRTRDSAPDSKQVVPTRERDIAAELAAIGPTQSKLVSAVTPLGSVALSGEFASIADRVLRAREIVVDPGGVVAVHQHSERPGMAYILEGEIVEHRNDSDEPIVRKAGAIAFEKTGVIHWWENLSSQPVRALVVDIVIPENTK